MSASIILGVIVFHKLGVKLKRTIRGEVIQDRRVSACRGRIFSAFTALGAPLLLKEDVGDKYRNDLRHTLSALSGQLSYNL